jgi:MoxR-like ATPase
MAEELNLDIRAIHEKVKKESLFVQELTKEISKVIVGQDFVVERLLIGLLGNGHILVEGVPGLAKTLMIKTLCDCINTKFQRIQFTPDLLPADLLGTMIFNPKSGDFSVKKGPIFSNIILADEINRAPAKVQSALLEAMQERQVTIADTTYKLEEPFLVLATQNPIEQEGTYPLPEAQVDRFMLKVKISYPDRAEEKEILERMTTGKTIQVKKIVNPQDILRARSVLNEVYVDEKIKNYIIDIVMSSREPDKYKLSDLKPLIAFGVSPRATIYLTMASKAYAFLHNRGYVTPDDVKSIAMDVLRHRLILTYEAEAEEMTTDDVVKQIIDAVEVP